MEIHGSIVDLIGNTPLVKLKSYNHPAIITGKLEAFNPGKSSKDRIATTIINEAERSGALQPGGTIVEATSGNTGLGLALVGINRGYKVILVMPDKMSAEKMILLKAIGCEVVVTPTNVEPDDPRSYYSVSKRIAEETPNAFYANQYHNPANPLAHYQTTGPEIWRQTEGKITHFICGIGTGGTISGTARYLKEQNANIKIIGVDPLGSILAYYHKNRTTEGIEAKGYLIEGVGEDIIPENVHFDLIDEVITVNDKEAFDWTRRLARDEGLLLGSSSGMVAVAIEKYLEQLDADSVVVALFPDTGERYLGKVYNDAWMRANQFLPLPTSIQEILNGKSANLPSIINVSSKDTIGDALERMNKFDIDEIIVDPKTNPRLLSKQELHAAILGGRSFTTKVEQLNLHPITTLDIQSPLKELINTIREDGSVLITNHDKLIGFISVYDLFSTFPATKLHQYL